MKKGQTFKIPLIIFVLINVFLICSVNQLYAQNPVITNIIEELAENSDLEDVDYSSFVDDLNFYLENPLNLNEADVEKLENLHFLNEFQINNLLNYIAIRNGMNTIYELQLIDGFNRITIDKMLPFVKVDAIKTTEAIDFDKIFKYGRHKLIAQTNFTIETPKAYQSETENSSSRYKGNKMLYKLRYNFHYKDRIFFGFSAEKDPGEQFNFTKKPYGFDFYSAHFQINNIGVLKRLNVGDFHAQFGQGLILSTGFGMGKSSDVMNIRKRGQSLRYYSSTNENNFLRGAGATLDFGKFQLTSFVSYKKIDATINSSDTVDNSENTIVSLQNSGYHRTETELKNRKTIGELIGGTKLQLALKNMKMSVNMVAYKYNKAIENSTKPYKLYYQNDDNNINASFDYLMYYKKMSFFGELASDKNFNIAVLNGFTASVVSQLSFSLLHRYYQKEYNANYAIAFAEGARINNEQGMYYGIDFYPFAKIQLSAYADIFRFAWLKYRVDAPSDGYDYLIDLKYSVNRYVKIDLKYKSKSKAINIQHDDKALKTAEEVQNEHYRFNIAYRLSDFVSLSNRIEVSSSKKNHKQEYGYMFYQDAKFTLKETPLSFYLRYSVFDASYDNRIYAYENDLLYSFSIPAYSGKGSSYYAMCKYDFSKFLSINVKYGQSFFPTVENIGSGLSAVSGNVKSYVKFQIIAKL